MMRRTALWTGQADAELLRLHEQGVSKLRLAVRFKRTERAVETRLIHLRKKHRVAPQAGADAAMVREA